MTNPTIPVDQRVWDLAEHFLRGNMAEHGEPPNIFENRCGLARHIQAAIEDWYAANEPSPENAEIDRG